MALNKKIKIFNNVLTEYHRISYIGKVTDYVEVVIKSYANAGARETEVQYDSYIQDMSELYSEYYRLKNNPDADNLTVEETTRMSELEDLITSIRGYAHSQWKFYVYETKLMISVSEIQSDLSYDAIYEYLMNNEGNAFYKAESI